MPVTKKLEGPRFLVEETYDLPFPLSERVADAYYQIFNNLEVDGTLRFVARSFEKGRAMYKLPHHAHEAGQAYLSASSDYLAKRSSR